MTRPAAAAALLPLLLALAPCARRAERPPNIVLLTLDTVRADHLGCYGRATRAGSPSPVADRLAREGTLFLRCEAPRGQTHPSLASLLTGLYPATHGLRDNGQDLAPVHVPFPVLLRRAGYRTAAFCSNLDRTRWPFWVRGFEVAEDGVEGRLLEEGGGESWRKQRLWDERTVKKAIAWIEGLDTHDAAPPFFLWVHLYDAHQPYTPPPELAERFLDPAYEGPFRDPTGERAGGEPGDRVSPLLVDAALGRRALDDADRRAVEALYDASILGCERRLQRVLDALEEKGLLADALVVYSADHGEELGVHADYYGHGNSIHGDVLRVPLLLRWPGRIPAGRRVDALCQNLDLCPTVLEAAGLAVPESVEGRSLWPLLSGEAASVRPFAFAEWEDLVQAVTDGRFRWVHNPRGAQPRKPPYHAAPEGAFPLPCFALYDLSRDPEERVDVASRHEDVAARLRAALRAFLAAPEHARPIVLPEEADPALEALGYVQTARRRHVRFVPCDGTREEGRR